MKRIGTATLAVFLGILLVTMAIVAVVSLGTDGGAALEVGGTTLSRQSLNDELRAFADNDRLAKAVGPQNVSASDGSVVWQASAFLATFWIQQQLAQRVLDRQRERVTGTDRSQAQRFLDGNLGGAFGGFPAWLRTRLRDRVAPVVALNRIGGSAYQRVLAREGRRVGVRVDPVYGRYSPARVAIGRFPTPATPTAPSSQG